MINKVTLIGNTGGDPEVKTLENGGKVARFSLATSESYKDKEGTWQKTTEWHTIVVWRDLAERVEKYLKKGMSVYVDGKISYRKHTDKEGVERHYTDIVASNVRMLDKPKDNGNDSRFPDSNPTQFEPIQANTKANHGTPPDNYNDLMF